MDNLKDNAQNVVAMTDFQHDTAYSAIAQVEAYWEAVRGARLLPKRSEIDPRGIEHALEHAFILERITPGIARLRIAGSHLTDLMGMEVRGMPLTSFFSPAARPAVSELLEVVFQTPATATLRMHSPAGGTRTGLDARMILLPLKSDLGDVSRVLGCFVSKGEIGLAPRRFDVVSQEVRQIQAGTAPRITPQTPQKPAMKVPPAKTDAAPAGAAEDQTRFVPKNEKPRPPYLRLVKSDD